MGGRSRNKETAARLGCESLDGRFLEEIRRGLGCSPFEAQAVLDVVREVYFPFLDEASPQAPPGKVTLIAVSADEPAGKPLAQCEKRTVSLTVHRGAEDDATLHKQGSAAFRKQRIADLCQEALSQGALLTCEDLAYRVFFVSPRTITRDLGALRRDRPGVPISLRSTVHDIGPVLSHRTQIVRFALEGKTTTQICEALHHSPRAVANYLSTFLRCAHLARRGMQAGQIAFLLRRGKALIQRYLQLLDECEGDRNMRYHLDELMRFGEARGGKRRKRGGRCHG